jgi:hypothetical protein
MVGHPSGTRITFCFNTYCQYSPKNVLQRRGQRLQVQKRLKDLVHPDIVGHFVDPAGRRQEGAAGECRSEGSNRDFLALGRWGRGGTAGTTGSALRFCGCHFFLRKQNLVQESEDFVAGPRTFWILDFGFWMEMQTMVDESTLNLTVILHGTTQTRCTLATLNNVSCLPCSCTIV